MWVQLYEHKFSLNTFLNYMLSLSCCLGSVFHGYYGFPCHSNSGVIFYVSLVNLSPTSFCAKRASSRLVRTYFYGWHRPQSCRSTSWYWQSAYCPPCRPFTDDSGALQCLFYSVEGSTDSISSCWKRSCYVPVVSLWKPATDLKMDK